METSTASKLLDVIAEETGFPRRQMTLATRIDELGVDSLEFVELMQIIGEKFKQIPDAKFAGLTIVDEILKAVE